MYSPKIDFDNPDEADKLIIFLQESFYERRNEEVVELYRGGDFGDTWNPLYAGIKIGFKIIPLKFADTVYLINYDDIRYYAKSRAGDSSEEEAWRDILEYAENGKMSFDFDMDKFRDMEVPEGSQDKFDEELVYYPRRIYKKLVDKELSLSLRKRIPNSEKLLALKDELVESRKEAVAGDALRSFGDALYFFDNLKYFPKFGNPEIPEHRIEIDPDGTIRRIFEDGTVDVFIPEEKEELPDPSEAPAPPLPPEQ